MNRLESAEMKLNKFYLFLTVCLNFWNYFIKVVTSKKFVFGLVVVLLIISFGLGFLFKYQEVKAELAWKQYLRIRHEEMRQKKNDEGVRFIMGKYQCDSLSIYETIMESETPVLLAAVVAKESGFNRMAISPVGARGLGQVMPYHFKKNEDCFDPQTNLRRANIILQDNLKQCNGDEILALASYNAGLGRVIKAGWKVPDTKNNETKNYVKNVSNLVNEAMMDIIDIYQ